MSRYFTLEDNKSSKFWQVETLDTTLTVSYGRIGTAGQSQTKTFDTPDRCEQEAAKLIREKTGKGYTELVNGTTVPAITPATPKPAKANDTVTIETVLNRYDGIIRNTQVEELLPFLKSVDKRFYKELEIKAASLNKTLIGLYLRHIVKTNSEKLAIEDKKIMIRLSQLVLSNKGDVWNKFVVDELVGYANRDSLLPILLAKRPTWLVEYYLKESRQWVGSTIDYKKLRWIEERGILDYHPELFAFSAVYYLSSHGSMEGAETQINWLISDEKMVQRDMLAFFDYPISVHEVTYSVKKPDHSYESIRVWSLVFSRLMAEGKLDRLWFFEKCLSVQTKDWPADLRSFCRKQIEANYPTTAEWLALQSSLLPLLAGQHPHVVSWAVTQVKAIYTEPDFRVGEMLDWAAPVMMRADCKTALKTLLTMLKRVAKTQPEYRPAIANLLADVFTISDLPVQTKAAQLLVKFGDPADAALQNSLQTYAGQMLGTVSADLRAFLETDPVAEVSGPVTYQYAPPKPGLRLLPERAVSLPKTWNEFVFLIGKFIGSDDPLDAELLMNALILPPADMPDDWQEQLAVYAKKLEKLISFDGLDIFTVLYLWIVGRLSNYVKPNRCVDWSRSITSKRLIQVYNKIESYSSLPLLSMPTHSSFWVDPSILIERLIAYQKAKEPIDTLDLAIAIARMPLEKLTRTALLSTQIEGEIGVLLRYFFDNDSKQESNLDLSFRIHTTTESNADLIMLWAVAARTFAPDKNHSFFEHTDIADIPYTVSPFVPNYKIVDLCTVARNWKTGELYNEVVGRGLVFEFPVITNVSQLLLYSSGNYKSIIDSAGEWFYSHPLPPSIIPQFLEPIFARAKIHTSSYCDIKNELHLTLKPDFHFREMSMLVLACGLLAKKRETGALAAEVLIQHFGEQTLDATRIGDRLGWLLAGHYAPVQRLTDALNLVRDVSPRHNKALLLLLDALLAQLASMTELPKNTKKLLEGYLDLLVKCAEKPTPETAVILTNWREIATLKKLCQDALTRS